MKAYKKWSLSVLVMSLLLVACAGAFNYVLDPLQFYRKAFYPPDFSAQQRFQNPGLAKNYDYDTIVIGSSMTENFLPSFVNEKLGVHMLKLSMSGASFKEQYMIAKLAIETGKVKNVIWGIDYFSLRGHPDRVREEYGQFPFYLYDNNLLNDYHYVLNVDTTLEAARVLAASRGIAERENPSLETLNTWLTAPFGRQKVLAEWQKISKGGQFTPADYEREYIWRNMDQNLIALVQANPQIDFTLYYPPYSVLQHRFFYEKSAPLFENELEAKQYLFDKLGAKNNVKFFDFQAEKSITFDLDNYKDLAHHSPKINEYIIESFVNGSHLVTKESLQKTAEQLKQQVEELDVDKL
ncbi:MAG: hypothetical protein ACM32O_17715 [Clostridia bacterium]